jgi:rhodanese-related sulfurtransferase
MGDQRQHYLDKLAYEIDSWDLHAAREAGNAVVVIDARSAEAFAREHIAGAINLPHRAMNAESTKHLIEQYPDGNALIVTYCDGIGCNASTKGALAMLDCLSGWGFRVKELMGGLDWWKRDGYKTEDGPTGGAAAAGCGCG